MSVLIKLMSSGLKLLLTFLRNSFVCITQGRNPKRARIAS